MAMTKDDQIRAVAKNAELTHQQARKAIEAMETVVTVGLILEGKITTGLGIFEVRRRGARRVLNPATGDMMDLEAKNFVKFKPSADLRRQVEAIES